MKNRITVIALCPFLLALYAFAQAQQPTKMARIGYLSSSSPPRMAPRIETFRQGLRELGYREGKNIVVEWRFAEGKREHERALAAELAGLKVDAIVTGGNSATRAAKEATNSISIIMTQANDPVGSGFIASLGRPGGNITGLANFSPELSGKRLELLKEIVPRVLRVAIFGTSTSPGDAQELKEMERAAGALGVRLQYVDVLSAKDIEAAFRAANNEQADAVLMNVSGSLAVQRKEIVTLAAKSRLPTIYERREFVEDGGLMSYGINLTDLDRRVAVYVDKILRGAKPAELPVEQPTKFELVIHLKTAKQIGLSVPPQVLARADRVIR